MITNAEKVEMFKMRLAGSTLQEIGDKYGLTRERVRQLLCGAGARDAAIARGCKGIMYPAISNWLQESNVSLGELYVMMGNKPSNTGTLRISKILHGYAPYGFRIIDIRKILKITGMSFEEAFAESEKLI